ncbi:MAG: hypothetical protein PHI06_08345, partial [Desulfobulbaceae bacterium]|nr:hypothetical protein [Desulfobulbaceae bacterium]
MKTSTMKFLPRVFLFLLIGLGLGLPNAGAALLGQVSDTNKHAWSEASGWQNFQPTSGGVTINSDHLTGFAWAANIGWIKLGADSGGPYANTSATNWGVNRDPATGNLSGYAWSEAVGWINFSPNSTPVNIDLATGDFTGYAYNGNIGYIHFANASPAYKVQASIAAPTCSDGIKNGSETGIDCGGGTCSPCDAGEQCTAGSDCISGNCSSGLCQASYTLTVSKSGSGSGSVDSSPAGISCGADCSENYGNNAVVTLTPHADTGSAFTGWTGACTGAGPTCQVTLDADKSVNAIFSSITPTTTILLQENFESGDLSAYNEMYYGNGYSHSLTIEGTTDKYIKLQDYGMYGNFLGTKQEYNYVGNNIQFSADMRAGSFPWTNQQVAAIQLFEKNAIHPSTDNTYLARLTIRGNDYSVVAERNTVLAQIWWDDNGTLTLENSALISITNGSVFNYGTIFVKDNGIVEFYVNNQLLYTSLNKISSSGDGLATFAVGARESYYDNLKIEVGPISISGNVGVPGAILSYTDGTAKTVIADENG